MISLPFAVVVIVATWLLSAGITYGILKTKIDNMTERINHHDEEIIALRHDFVPRKEHEVGYDNVVDRLTRIERKIDALPR